MTATLNPKWKNEKQVSLKDEEKETERSQKGYQAFSIKNVVVNLLGGIT